MKLSKATFKKILKECILELHQEGKLGALSPAPVSPVALAQGFPWGGPQQGQGSQAPQAQPGGAGGLYESALLDTLANEYQTHRIHDLSGLRTTMPAPGMLLSEGPPPSSMHYPAQGTPTQGAARPVSPGLPQQVLSPSQGPLLPPVVPVGENTDILPPGATSFLPGADKWAKIAFSKRRSNNL